MTDVICGVTYINQSNETSILTVKLNDISMKCMKMVSKNPEDWIENIISSRCFPKCEQMWCEHAKVSIENNNTPKSKCELIVGYEPSPNLMFEPRGKCIEIGDGSCEIEVEIDVIFTKCMECIFTNPSQEIEALICSRIEIGIDNIINESINRGTTLGKTKREIIMTYEREEIMDELDDDIIDENVKSQVEEDLQTEKEKTQQLEVRLSLLESTLASLIS